MGELKGTEIRIGKLVLSRRKIVNIVVICLALLLVILMASLINNGGSVVCPDCFGNDPECETCGGTGHIEVDNRYFGTFVALVPPIIAIVLALVTKEVYSSLFVGIVCGALFMGEFKPIESLDIMINDGFFASIADSWNAGILIFLVILGIMVALVNKAGGAKAFGTWAKKHIKTKFGAQIATFILGILIFIDDYFNCLTVGSVMRPVIDGKKVSREKFAYLIDATAAPICMIAPVSSWAAAVSSTASQVGENGISLFLKAIPYNYYSLLTIVMILAMLIFRVEYGPMKKFEKAAEMMDDIKEEEQEEVKPTEEKVKKSKPLVIDLIIPVVVLIIACVFGMIYSGGIFEKGGDNYGKLIQAFGDADASFGLTWGSIIALIFTIIYFICRRRLTFKETMESVPKGFIAMVPAILILIFAWTLNSMTSGLGAAGYVGAGMNGAAAGLKMMLPAIIFLVALGLAFATGTSWGTFGILIPIVVAVFGSGNELLIIGISACLAGAVCGDHCSPISDTTIMASAGANCNHVNHVNTQLPYALTVAGVSFVSFILAGVIRLWYVCLIIGVVLMVGTVIGIKYLDKYLEKKKTAKVTTIDSTIAMEAMNTEDALGGVLDTEEAPVEEAADVEVEEKKDEE